tara:strand:- start:25 stop:525 length:501 start_codon:yes stop_codon:yes gene_type:complete
MTSIIKVDQIQTLAGTAPTAADLGINVTGSVLQVVQTATTATATTTSGTFSATGLSATITPSLTSSKVLVMVSGGMEGAAGGSSYQVVQFKVYRNGTSIEGSTFGKRIYLSPNLYTILDFKQLDSPSSTSALTYALYFARQAGDGTSSWNRDGGATVTLILMEIAG